MLAPTSTKSHLLWIILGVLSYDILVTHGSLLLTRTRNTLQSQVRWEDEKITCKDEDGLSLDWFVVYKLAKLPHSNTDNIREGYGHAVLHPGLNNWILSPKSINSSDSVVGLSTRNIFQGQGEDYLYLVYNDQPPDGKTIDNNGHTKGVIIANENGGIWLQHSVPHFPQITSDYSYPTTGTHNGQIFFCMTLSPKQIDETVGGILKITRPHVYKTHFPLGFSQTYPNLKSLIPGHKRTGFSLRRRWGKTGSQFQLDVGRLNLTIFAKSPKQKQEIYSDWIAPTLTSNLNVQSWLNGPHALNCTLKPFKVQNIKDKTISSNEFSTHNDHSKWAVGEKGWTCIADLNRMEHQMVRGGAALCTQDQNLWSNFQHAIVDFQPCPTSRSSRRNTNG